jgi:hypothetical protein
MRADPDTLARRILAMPTKGEEPEAAEADSSALSDDGIDLDGVTVESAADEIAELLAVTPDKARALIEIIRSLKE